MFIHGQLLSHYNFIRRIAIFGCIFLISCKYFCYYSFCSIYSFFFVGSSVPFSFSHLSKIRVVFYYFHYSSVYFNFWSFFILIFLIITICLFHDAARFTVSYSIKSRPASLLFGSPSHIFLIVSLSRMSSSVSVTVKKTETEDLDKNRRNPITRYYQCH